VPLPCSICILHLFNCHGEPVLLCSYVSRLFLPICLPCLIVAKGKAHSDAVVFMYAAVCSESCKLVAVVELSK